MKKATEKKDIEKIKKDLEEKNLELFDIRFGKAGAGAKNVKKYGTLKKEIARIKTTLNNQ